MTNQSTVNDASLSNSENSISTFGWDTVYVAPYTVVNHAIQVQQSFPNSFNYTDEPTGMILRGTWSLWQICVGGSGKNIQMECLVKSGTVTYGGQGYSLDNSRLIIQVNLKDVAAEDPVNSSIAPGGYPRTLVVDPEAHSSNDPAVAVLNGQYPAEITGLLRSALNQVFANYFNSHIQDFNHTFAVMDLSTVANKDSFQWIRPTAFQYAVASPEDATLDNSAFGLIAMVDGNTISPYQQQAVDSRALQQLSPGANSAFVISQDIVTKHILMQGAIATIQGSSAQDFSISSDGLSIVNSRDIVWGKFKTDHGNIAPTIKKGNFTLRIDEAYVLVEIIDAEYENSPGVTVRMNLTQQFTYRTIQKKNGEYIFIPDVRGLGEPHVSATVSLSKALQITEVAIGAIAILASLVSGGAAIAGRLLASADVVVDEAANEASIEMGEIENIEEESEGYVDIDLEEPAEQTLESEEAVQQAARSVSEGTQGIQSGGVCTINTVRNVMGVTAAISGMVSGGIAAAKAITEMNYDNIPAFNEFAANCLAGTAWPATTGYRLKSASFRGSLVLNMELMLDQEPILNTP